MKSMVTMVAGCLAATVLVVPAFADDGDNARRGISVQKFGAVCNGKHDDTNAFKKAVAAAPVGFLLTVPAGQCVLTDTIVIDKPLQIAGVGFGSQVLGK